jgi:hypothetical protein
MHADDELLFSGTRCRDPIPVQHMRVRQHVRAAAPTRLDGLGRAGCEGDQRARRGDEDVLLLLVGTRCVMVRVAQVVHRVHQRHVVHRELLHDIGQILRAQRVETEMDVEDVEPMVVVGDPAGLEHQRRPPATRYLAPVLGDRVVKSDNVFGTFRGIARKRVGSGQMPYVHMRRRHGGDAQHGTPCTQLIVRTIRAGPESTTSGHSRALRYWKGLACAGYPASVWCQTVSAPLVAGRPSLRTGALLQCRSAGHESASTVLASIERAPLPWATSMCRGLARSASGIVTVRTPFS